MTLIKTGQGVTNIRGGTGGVYFSRDKSGLHQSRKPRTVKHRSTAQDKQRKAFTTARQFCICDPRTITDKTWLNRCVSYNIYRVLNGLEPQTPPVEYQISTL